MADAGPFNIGDILPFVNPCGYINHTVPFIFPRRNILNNSLIADFDSSFNGEPPFTERKLACPRMPSRSVSVTLANAEPLGGVSP